MFITLLRSFARAQGKYFLLLLVSLTLFATSMSAGIIFIDNRSCTGTCYFQYLSLNEAGGLGTFQLHGTADVDLIPYFVPGALPWQFSESVYLKFDATTIGPARPGFLDLQYNGFGFGDFLFGSAGGSIVDVFDWGFAGGVRHTLIPYTLGTPFEIRLFASGQASLDFSGHGHVQGATASFQLQIRDGSPTGPLVQIADVPEPRGLAAGGLLMLLAGVLLSRRKARSRSPR